MTWHFMEFLGEHCEPTVFRMLALGTMTGVGLLVANDLLHSPPRQYPAVGVAMKATAAGGPVAAADSGRPVAKVEAMAEARGEMRWEEVTVFTRVPLDTGGRHLAVVSADVYRKSGTRIRSYCYLDAGGRSAIELSVRLATREGDGPVKPAELHDADSRAVDFPLDQLRAAAAACRFA